MSFERPEDEKPTDKPTMPQTPEEARQRAVSLLDAAGMYDTARDFLTCCRPFHAKTEAYHAGQFEYWSRLHNSVTAWMRMNNRDRDTLIAGARDGVHWRGESAKQFQETWNETMKSREMGVDKYRRQVQESLRRFTGRAKS